MEFDYYFDDGQGGTEGFEEYFQFVRRVALEDFELCETAQRNLERGVYSQGCLNGEKEKGVVREYFPLLFFSVSPSRTHCLTVFASLCFQLPHLPRRSLGFSNISKNPCPF
jgi:hypothetical protein